MWVIVMFDLPTDTRKAKKEYSLFRKFLLEDGFQKMQYSIYSRHCPSGEIADVHTSRVQGNLPPGGEVRVITITDKQFEKMDVFFGKTRKLPETAPSQLQLF
jgi:CRISPR-associated protein Cas2